MKIKLHWRTVGTTAIFTFVLVLVLNKLMLMLTMHDDMSSNPSKFDKPQSPHGLQHEPSVGINAPKQKVAPTYQNVQLKTKVTSEEVAHSRFDSQISQPKTGLNEVGKMLKNSLPVYAEESLSSTQREQESTQKTEIMNAKSTILTNENVKGKGRTPKINNYANNMPPHLGISWKDFLSLPRFEDATISSSETHPILPFNPNFQPISFCSPEVEKALTLPRLTPEQQQWCKWALSRGGGAVVVGKSWGNLKTKTEKEDFDDFNCNAFAKGINPSCDDAWGDATVSNWMKSVEPSIQCRSGSSSSVSCIDNENGDRQCSFRNAQINFGYMADQPRALPATTPTKKFKKGFFSVDCPQDTNSDNFLKFEHLYSSKVQSSKCDYVINGTVLLYSHDDIRNLGHTMNDILNVFMLRWLHRIARHSHEITFLNVDSFNLGHNHHDTISNPFYTTYNKTFDILLKGRDFGSQTVCMQKVLMQSSPPKFFVWDSWFRDHDCTYRGPSSLFQRYNLEVRQRYGLLSNPDSFPTNRQIRVLMLVRKQTTNLWGDSQTSRNHLNQPAVDRIMNETLLSAFPKVHVVYETASFEHISFEQQMRMVASSTVLIGMHGAGITQGLHMPIGSKYCCGVIEIFPDGYYRPIRGHANMMRKTGLKYARLEISKDSSTPNGATIPAVALAEATVKLLGEILAAPSCIIRKAYDDPFLETV